jgi:hypothetical protein
MGSVPQFHYPVYLQLTEDEVAQKREYREFVRGMPKEKEAMKGEMDRRIRYDNKTFVQEMTTAYKVSEKIQQIGRQTGWRKTKENRPL